MLQPSFSWDRNIVITSILRREMYEEVFGPPNEPMSFNRFCVIIATERRNGDKPQRPLREKNFHVHRSDSSNTRQMKIIS